MLYELSLKFSQDLARYDDTIPVVQLDPFCRIKEGAINNQSSINLFLHLGTHLDAPYHFCEDGFTIDELDVSDFIFRKALLIDAECEKGGRIDRAFLARQPHIDEADILLINFGYCKYMDQEAVYRDNFPALTLDAAKYIRNELPNVKAIAIDTLSVDGTDGFDTGFANHHALLDTKDSLRTVLIYECVDMRPIENTKKFFSVYGIPIRIVGADASPVTVIAEID